jgi:hypothetical protein
MRGDSRANDQEVVICRIEASVPAGHHVDSSRFELVDGSHDTGLIPGRLVENGREPTESLDGAGDGESAYSSSGYGDTSITEF